MATRESTIQSAIVADLKAIKRSGVPIWWSKISDQFARGTPDLLIVATTRDGRQVTLFVEIKTDSGRPSAIQRHVHKQIRAAGHTVEIARSVGDVRRLLCSLGVT